MCAGLLSSGEDFPMSISTFLSIKSDKKILALKYRPHGPGGPGKRAGEIKDLHGALLFPNNLRDPATKKGSL